jgi:hypothetical protein
MISLGTIFSVGKGFKHLWDKADEEDLRCEFDFFRSKVYSGEVNTWLPEVGSEQDRRCARMADKGWLVRDMFGGYMLAESRQHRSSLGY